MTRSIFGVVAVVAAVAAPAAFAQYRPPPMTEAERYVSEGDEERVKGGKAVVAGDKRAAAERYKKAIELYRKALAANPASIPAATGLGDAANTLGDHKLIAEVLGAFDKANPGSVDVAYYLGVALYKLKRPQDALPYLQMASKANKPEHLLVHYYLGRHYLFTRQPKDSVIELGQYLAQRPARLAGSDHEIYTLLGHAYLMSDEPGRARTSFQNAQKGRPESLPLQLGIASALAQESKEGEAISLLNGLAQRFPKNAEPREQLGWLYLGQKKLADAEAQASAAVKLQPTANGHYLLGQVLLAKNNPSGAEPNLRKALQLAPQMHEARLSLARALQMQKRHDDAIGLLEQAREGGLDTPELWANLGSVYRRAGRFREAVAAHQTVVKMLPQSAVGHVLLGADRFATGEWERAIEHYDEALKLDPKSAPAARWLAEALTHRARQAIKAGQLEDASRDLRRAADLYPAARISRSLGAVLLAQQKHEEAQKVLARAVTQGGAGWKESLLLGYAHLGMRALPEAVAAFERAASLTTDTSVHGDIYAAWALAKLELGEFDIAIAKLSEAGASSSASRIREGNLPLALVRRAMDRVAAGDAESANKDLELVGKLTRGRSDDLKKLANLAEALVDVEGGRYAQAQSAIRRTFAGKSGPKWARKNTEQLVSAYVAYRKGDVRSAQRLMSRAARGAPADQQTWLTQFGRALDRRSGELAYKKGSMTAARRSLEKALADEPLNPWVVHNLACVQHALRKHKDAVQAWEKVKGSIVEAHLNLGIDAQVRERNVASAVTHYGRYIAARGERAGLAREWRDRLMALYGIDQPLPTSADEALAAGDDEQAEGSADDDKAPVAQEKP